MLSNRQQIKKKTANLKKFQFESFNDRIKNIKIHKKIFYSRHFSDIVTVDDVDHLQQSFFLYSINQHSQQNGSLAYQHFLNEIWSYIQSIPLLVYHKDKIINILKRYLKQGLSQVNTYDSLHIFSLLDIIPLFS